MSEATQIMKCNACKKEITGVAYLLFPEQKGEWCSTECRNSQIVPFKKDAKPTLKM